MLKIKDKFKSYCTIFMLCFSVCNGSQPQMDNQQKFSRVYVTQDDVVFENGRPLILDGKNMPVKTFHQDSNGIYYYRAWLYGTDPDGFPYGPDDLDSLGSDDFYEWD
jgi:hypothetical protein